MTNVFTNSRVIWCIQLLFQKLEFLRIKDIFEIQISKFVFECLHKISPTQFHLWFETNVSKHNHATRANSIILSDSMVTQTFNLFIPYGRTTHYGLKSVKVFGPKIWNNIPIDIRSICSCKAFTKACKKHYISQYM